MSEGEKSRPSAEAWARFGTELMPALPVVGIFLSGALMLIGISIGSKWDGHIHTQAGCFQLQEIKGRTFKVDTCSGKIEEVELPVAAPTNPALPTPKP